MKALISGACSGWSEGCVGSFALFSHFGGNGQSPDHFHNATNSNCKGH
jgi:hypothetical protein